MLVNVGTHHIADARSVVRCPDNLVTDELVENPHDATKYYRCTAAGALVELSCAAGELFDVAIGRCSDNTLEQRLVQWRFSVEFLTEYF